MGEWTVEVRGEVREVYVVEADNEAEAMEKWNSGLLVLSEASSCEPVSASAEDSNG